MLARLLEIGCVADVGVDRTGTHLRLQAREDRTDGCIETVTAWLEREGVFVEPAADGPRVDRWYGPGEVRELSRAEAEELGAQAVRAVVPPPGAATAERVRDLVAGHLHDAFVTHHLERGERVPLKAAVDRIRADVAPLLSAGQLGSLMRQLASTIDLTEHA